MTEKRLQVRHDGYLDALGDSLANVIPKLNMIAGGVVSSEILFLYELLIDEMNDHSEEWFIGDNGEDYGDYVYYLNYAENPNNAGECRHHYFTAYSPRMWG